MNQIRGRTEQEKLRDRTEQGKPRTPTRAPLSGLEKLMLIGLVGIAIGAFGVEQIYLASPSRFPVMIDLSCRVISASEA